jgi:hypothetical protein
MQTGNWALRAGSETAVRTDRNQSPGDGLAGRKFPHGLLSWDFFVFPVWATEVWKRIPRSQEIR